MVLDQNLVKQHFGFIDHGTAVTFTEKHPGRSLKTEKTRVRHDATELACTKPLTGKIYCE